MAEPNTKSDWSSEQYLYELLSQHTFKSVLGEMSKLLLLVNEDELISFCTYAEIDDIQPTDITLWMGWDGAKINIVIIFRKGF